MQITSCVQQLAGLLFHVAIIAQTLPQFQKVKSRRHGLFHTVTTKLPGFVAKVRQFLRTYVADQGLAVLCVAAVA